MSHVAIIWSHDIGYVTCHAPGMSPDGIDPSAPGGGGAPSGPGAGGAPSGGGGAAGMDPSPPVCVCV